MAFSFNFDIPLQTDETNDKDDKVKEGNLTFSVREFIISLLKPANLWLMLQDS